MRSVPPPACHRNLTSDLEMDKIEKEKKTQIYHMICGTSTVNTNNVLIILQR